MGNIKMGLKEVQGKVARYCEHVNETSDSIKAGPFHDWLGNC
jgi:hypothetical protein